MSLDDTVDWVTVGCEPRHPFLDFLCVWRNRVEFVMISMCSRQSAITSEAIRWMTWQAEVGQVVDEKKKGRHSIAELGNCFGQSSTDKFSSITLP
jgi:hypothetical protein